METRRNFIKKTLGLVAVTPLLGAQAVQTERTDDAAMQPARKGRLGARPSPWFTELPEQRVRCDLCPRKCRLNPGERGACKVRENRRGKGYTLVYGTPAILQTDPVERKPFFHVLPGSRSISVATAGCNFHCKFCQVWDMALAAPENVHAYAVTPAAVVEHARNADTRSVAYTFGEPVVFFEYMLDIAQEVRQAGLLNLLHSNGAIEPAPLRELSSALDGANIDLKGFDQTYYRDVCGGDLAPVLRTLQHLREAGVHLEITTLIIPTLNDQPSMIRRLTRWVFKELGAQTPLHLLRFYPLYQLANLPPTPVSTLEQAKAIAHDEGLQYVYLSNVTGHPSESTYCPQCEQVVIDRIGFMVDAVNIENGTCAHCGEAIKGVWEG